MVHQFNYTPSLISCYMPGILDMEIDEKCGVGRHCGSFLFGCRNIITLEKVSRHIYLSLGNRADALRPH